MAKASIKLICHDCGGEFWAEKKCYSRDEANKWEAYVAASERVCPECYAKAMQIKREADRAAKSAEMANAAHCPIDLPALEGSEKQVKWATDLRNSVINQLNKRGIKWADVIAAMDTNEAAKVYVNSLMHTEAKWWIDNRGKAVFGGGARIDVI